MAYTRKIRIEYYQIVKANSDGSGNDESFDLRVLITRASNLTFEERTYNYYQEQARLDKLRYYKEIDVWYLNFVRLRQTKIPVLAKVTEEAEPFELAEGEYIGEDVTAVYDCKTGIFALQRNRDSLSASGVQAYLTELYGKEGKGIFLRPIPMTKVFERVQKVKCFRKITLKFASAKNMKRTNVITSSFRGLFNYFDSFENSKTATITISLGKGRKGTLDEGTVLETIREIQEMDGAVTGAELTVKEREDAPSEIIDLFSMKYHSFTTIKVEERKAIDYVECGDAIYKIYKEKKEDILSAL